jgi:hypothetical protein
MVAIWHTHGDSKFSNKFFSPNDTRVAKQLSKPFYLADYTGMLKVFNPNDKLKSSTLPKASYQRLPWGASRGTLIRDPAGKTVRIRTR